VINVNKTIIIVADALLLVIAYLGAYWLRFESITQAQWFLIYATIGPVVFTKLVIFSFTGLHAGPWRFTGILDLINIIKASAISFFVVLVGMIYFYYPGGFSRSVFIIDAILSILLISSFRLVIRLAYSRQMMYGVLQRIVGRRLASGGEENGKRALIYGANERGELLLRSLLSTHDSEVYRVMGFVDDDPNCSGISIHGVRHVGVADEMEPLITQYDISEVMIASNPGKDIVNRIFKACQKLEVTCRVIPPYLDVVHQRVGLSQLRNIEVEDLLRRDIVKIDYTNVSAMVSGKRVVVTGAAGSIGKQLCTQILEFEPSELVCVDHGENYLFYLQQEIRDMQSAVPCFYYCSDVTDRDKVEKIFSHHRPEIVFHAAAHKHVPLMEGNVDEVIKNNIGGTINVTDMADRYETGIFVFISTDKAVKPANIMGWTKRTGELYTQYLASRSRTKFLSVRFGNVLGSNGSVVPIFRKQIENGGPVLVTHPDTTRYFMTIPEAVLLILQAACLGERGDLMILDMGKPVRITELAELMIRMAGYVPGKDVEIRFTGLRPGEKVHEELVNEVEDIAKTSHSKIFVVKHRNINSDMIPEILDAVLTESRIDPANAYRIMKERLGVYTVASGS